MSVSLDIVPLSDSLDMYGRADPSSAYSLSGHVSISLKSSHSIFERRRAVNFLLQSLEITFEGQTELVSPKTGYTPIRLCSISRELAPSEPVEISNRGHEDSVKVCTWNVVFNLPIPGWLPETCHFGHLDNVGTVYTLFATAKFTNLDGSSACSFASLYSPFRSKTKYVHAEKVVIVNRFISPPAIPSSPKSLFPAATYGVDAIPVGDLERPDALHIPLDVLSKIQVLVSVPESVSMDEESLPFTIRLHSIDLDIAESKRLQVTEFSVKMYQIEKYIPRPSSEYTARFPLPSALSQPPNKPLLKPNSISTIYDIGLYFPNASQTNSNSRQFSILPTNESGIYVLSGDTYIFAPDDSDTQPTWYTMEASVPFVHQQVAKEPQWAGEPTLRPSAVSPLFEVRHEMRISLKCSYDVPGSENKAVERLNFSLPLHFVRVTPTPQRSLISHSTHASLSSVSGTAPLLANDVFTTNAPSAQCLPAYSQLFDYNGDRKIDYSVQLPPYTPPSPTTTTSSSSSSSSSFSLGLDDEVFAGCKTKMLDDVEVNYCS